MYVYWLFTSKVGDDWCILFFSLFLSSKRLAFISVGEGSSTLVGTKFYLGLINTFMTRYFILIFDKIFSGVPFSLFYQSRHPCIYSSFPESMQKVKISAISVCPLMCVMLPLPCKGASINDVRF